MVTCTATLSQAEKQQGRNSTVQTSQEQREDSDRPMQWVQGERGRKEQEGNGPETKVTVGGKEKRGRNETGHVSQE